jgi:hypothetical protein
MAVFSQPLNDTDDGSTAGADTSTPPPSWNVYPSLAAELRSVVKWLQASFEKMV